MSGSGGKYVDSEGECHAGVVVFLLLVILRNGKDTVRECGASKLLGGDLCTVDGEECAAVSKDVLGVGEEAVAGGVQEFAHLGHSPL